MCVILAMKKGGDAQVDAYCLKCRTKRQITKPQQVKLKNGQAATQGTCPVCGTKVYRLGKA